MSALACPVVEDVIHQPITVKLTLCDIRHSKYTPDYYLKYQGGGGCYIEVKPEIFLKRSEEKLAAAKEYFADVGERFLVVTDKHIDKNDLGARAILLMRYARMSFDAIEASTCIEAIESLNKQEVKVRDLMNKGISDSVIWNLVAKHHLKVPVGLELNEETPISIHSHEEDSHDLLCAWFDIETR